MKTLHISITTTVFCILACFSLTPVFGSEPDWQTLHVVGKYLGTNPPKPDQTFIFKYSTINGTVSNIASKDGSLEVKVDGDDSGQFEVQIPRNYPYTNFPYHGSNPNLIILKNGAEASPQDYKFVATECDFDYAVSFSGNTDMEILFTYIPEYNSFPFYGDKVPYHCISQTVYGSKMSNYMSPLNQIKSGVLPNDVFCDENTIFVMKRIDHSPACVKPDSASKLVLFGWAQNPLSNITRNVSGFFDSNSTTQQQDQFFYDMLNLPKLKEWSDTGWTFSKLTGVFYDSTKNIDRAYLELYLSPTMGNPKVYCEYGWYTWLEVDRNTLQIVNATYPESNSCTKQFQLRGVP